MNGSRFSGRWGRLEISCLHETRGRWWWRRRVTRYFLKLTLNDKVIVEAPLKALMLGSLLEGRSESFVASFGAVMKADAGVSNPFLEVFL